MGQCGCGETSVEHGYKLPSGVVVAYDIYRGCRDCFAGPAINVFVYPNGKSEWLRHAKIEELKPDEYGGNHGHGIPISFFEVRDLIAAAKQIGGLDWDEDGYGFEEWMEENGLQMMQSALGIFSKRMAELERRSKKKP